LRKLLPDTQASCPGTSVEPATRFLVERAPSSSSDRAIGVAVQAPHDLPRRCLPVLPADAGPLTLSTTPLATFAECPRKYRLVHEMGLEVPVWEGAQRSLRDVSIESVRAAGTAAHRALQRYPLALWGKAVDPAEIERRMVEELSTENPLVRGAAGNVARFLASGYAAHIRRSGATAYREEPFVLQLGTGREQLLLRGTIDLLVAFSDRSADVIDYKSSGRNADPSGIVESARDFQLRAYGLAARRAYDLTPVRAAIVDLSSPAEPAPAMLDENDHARFESRLLELRAAFVAARSHADFHGRARDQCAALRCGFIRACHGQS
jgi:ATP-dependent helicase/nuclease subunit A